MDGKIVMDFLFCKYLLRDCCVLGTDDTMSELVLMVVVGWGKTPEGQGSRRLLAGNSDSGSLRRLWSSCQFRRWLAQGLTGLEDQLSSLFMDY